MLFNKKLLFLFFIFFTSKTYAEKSLNFYDYEFLIPKKLDSIILNLKDYVKLNEKLDIDDLDINFFGISDQVILNENSKTLIISTKNHIKLYNDLKVFNQSEYENLIEKFAKKRCKNARTEKQCVNIIFKNITPTYWFLISEKISDIKDFENINFKDELSSDFKEFEDEFKDGKKVLDFDIDNSANGKITDIKLILDKENNPILHMSTSIKWNLNSRISMDWKANFYMFIHDDRMIVFSGECVDSKCKNIDNEMNLIISKLKSIDNIKKDNLIQDNKILIEAVGGIKKAYQIRRMYKYLFILL